MPLHRPRFLRALLVRPRLLLALGLGTAAWLALAACGPIPATARFLVSYDIAATSYLALALTMMARSSSHSIRRRAQAQDDGRFAVIAAVILAAVVSLMAIAIHLAVAKDLVGTARLLHVGLAGYTVFAAWAFTHLMFALHYAHDYYADAPGGIQGGLDFPSTSDPDYWDFLYFSLVIGTSGQTADVSFTNRRQRRVGLLHCTLAYVFNTTLLALTINVAASLF